MDNQERTQNPRQRRKWKLMAVSLNEVWKVATDDELLQFEFTVDGNIGKFGKKKIAKATIRLPDGEPFFKGDDLRYPECLKEWAIRIVLIKRTAIDRVKEKIAPAKTQCEKHPCGVCGGYDYCKCFEAGHDVGFKKGVNAERLINKKRGEKKR